MGWWSDDIMGGDTPLDLQSFIYNALGINEHPEDDEDITIPADAFDYKKIVKYLTDRDGNDYWLTGDTGNIFHQVLGILMMESGAPINKTLKAKMIKAAEQDEWAIGYTTDTYTEEGDEDRKAKMDAFIVTLNNYDNKTPTQIITKSLMETIFDGIASKEDNIPTIEDAVNDNDISEGTLRQLILAHVDDYRHENVNSLLDKLIEVTNKQ